MTSEKRTTRPAIQYGPTASTVAANVRRLRAARGMTTYALSGAVKKAGRPITPSAVAKIEKMQRQVTVDDLAALAVVFGVSPAALLLPLDDSSGQVIEVTGAGSVSADVAWEWASNERPLVMPEGDERTVLMEYQLYSLPPGRRDFRTGVDPAAASQLSPAALLELLDALQRQVNERGGGADGSRVD
jgi:transcriptional regulator with XRE-family HTH domain